MIGFMIWATLLLLTIWLMIGKRAWYEWLAYIEMKKLEALTATAWYAQECGDAHVRDTMLAEALSRIEDLDPSPNAAETPDGIKAEWDLDNPASPFGSPELPDKLAALRDESEA